MMEAFEATPRIAFLSPEKASGKTRALEVTSCSRTCRVDQRHACILDPQNWQPGCQRRLCFTMRSTQYGPRAKKDNEESPPFSMRAIAGARCPVAVCFKATQSKLRRSLLIAPLHLLAFVSFQTRSCLAASSFGCGDESQRKGWSHIVVARSSRKAMPWVTSSPHGHLGSAPRSRQLFPAWFCRMALRIETLTFGNRSLPSPKRLAELARSRRG